VTYSNRPASEKIGAESYAGTFDGGQTVTSRRQLRDHGVQNGMAVPFSDLPVFLSPGLPISAWFYNSNQNVVWRPIDVVKFIPSVGSVEIGYPERWAHVSEVAKYCRRTFQNVIWKDYQLQGVAYRLPSTLQWLHELEGPDGWKVHQVTNLSVESIMLEKDPDLGPELFPK
jgi:hypothetical protein